MVESESFKSQLRNALTEKLKQEVNATEVVFGQDNAPVNFAQKGVGNSGNIGTFNYFVSSQRIYF